MNSGQPNDFAAFAFGGQKRLYDYYETADPQQYKRYRTSHDEPSYEGIAPLTSAFHSSQYTWQDEQSIKYTHGLPQYISAPALPQVSINKAIMYEDTWIDPSILGPSQYWSLGEWSMGIQNQTGNSTYQRRDLKFNTDSFVDFRCLNEEQDTGSSFGNLGKQAGTLELPRPGTIKNEDVHEASSYLFPEFDNARDHFSLSSSYTASAGDAYSADSNAETELGSIVMSTPCDTTDCMAIDTNVNSASLVEADQIKYDACFGVLVAETSCSLPAEQTSKIHPVNLSLFGDIIKVHFQESNKYAGLLSVCGLCSLLTNTSIILKATLILSEIKSNPAADQKIDKRHRGRACSIRITVYGFKSDSSSINELLSSNGLCLQQPSALECDEDVEYHNPQYLLRPGSQMPALEIYSLTTESTESSASKALDEGAKNRVMRIFDSATGIDTTPQVFSSPRLQSNLKQHQLSALAFMMEKECDIVSDPSFPPLWEKSCEVGKKEYQHSVTKICESNPRPMNGGILADVGSFIPFLNVWNGLLTVSQEMGLGKTLSLLALVCSSLDILQQERHQPSAARSQATLIITPKSTIPGWQNQIRRHIHAGQIRVAVFHDSIRQDVQAALDNSDLVLTTYETVRSDWAGDKLLYSYKWHRIVLDEAHHIRNRTSQTFEAVSAVPSLYRWCLTGTPIQNRIDDYGALLSFIGVHSFTEKPMFDYWITSPLHHKRIGSLERLQKLVKVTCLRRTKKSIKESCGLPQRVLRTEILDFQPADQALYDFFKDKTIKAAKGTLKASTCSTKSEKLEEGNVLALINFLRLICNHGEALLPVSAMRAWRSRDSRVKEEIDMLTVCTSCDACGSEMVLKDLIASSQTKNLDGEVLCETCAAENGNAAANVPVTSFVPLPQQSEEAGQDLLPEPNVASTYPSAKVEALLRNLQAEKKGTDGMAASKNTKSYWTRMLDLIEQALRKHGFGVQRIDGKSSLQHRTQAMRQFEMDPVCTVMLASIGSAGEGVDMSFATHLHLIEPHWNPMAEAQAIDRVHRIGQTQDVAVTRYIMRDSVEQYIQDVQRDKLRLISQSIDSPDKPQSEINEERWKKLGLYLK